MASARAVYLCGNLDVAWHGVDRLLKIAHLCPTVEFLLIGGRSGDDLDLSSFGGVPPNLDVRGPVYGTNLDELLQSSTLGIGTLALERKNMLEACALKVREYLANGLPVYLPHIDTDFDEGQWFVRVAPTAELTDPQQHAEQIAEFAAVVAGRVVSEDDLQGCFFRDKERDRLRAVVDRVAP